MIKDSAKTIICYGDSNTWGKNPSKERYLRSMRWVNILQNSLGDTWEVISEGLCGRTFVALDPKRPYLTGITHLESILQTHKPVDLVVVMLGTNDVKSGYNLSAQDIANHLEQTIKLIRDSEIQKILVVCPPQIIIPEKIELRADFADRLDIMASLPALFKIVSEKHDCSFINAQDYISSSKIDGFHLNPEAHKKLADVLKEQVLNLNI